MLKSSKSSLALLFSAVAVWFFFIGSGEVSVTKKNNNGDGTTKSNLKASHSAKDTSFHSNPLINYSPLEKFEAEKSDSLFNSLADKDRFNGTALFAHDGKVLCYKCYGYSNFSTFAPLTDSSEFQLGSISKQFTAVAIMMLKEQGKLNYDDRVTDYFPDFPYKGVTIRMLLDHRSGLPNYIFTCGPELKCCDTLIDNMDLMNLLATYKPECYFAPNKKYDYCNTNYTVLAAIIESVSGVPYAQFITQNIFKPLGMTHTHVYDKYDTVIPDKVTGYEHNFKKAGDDYLDGVAGDKGIYSTAGDLLKWDQALYTDKLLKQSTLKEAWEPYTRWMGGKSYGFGWHLMLFGNDTIIYHNGWWHGFNAAFIRDVKEKNTIIVLSNRVNWCTNKSYSLLGLFRKIPFNAGDVADNKE